MSSRICIENGCTTYPSYNIKNITDKTVEVVQLFYNTNL